MTKFLGNTLFSTFISFTPEELIRSVRESGIMSVDIETKRGTKRNQYREDVYIPGLDPYVSEICMVQVYDGKVSYIIDARVTDISFLKPLLEDESILKIGHNLQFEQKFFKVHLDAVMVNVWDTMIAEKVLYNGAKWSYSLAALCDRYLGKKKAETSLFDASFHNKVTTNYQQLQDQNDLVSVNTTFSGKGKDMYEEAYESAMMDYIDKSTRMGFVNIGDRPFTKKEINYGAADVVDPYKIYLKQLKGNNGYFPKESLDLEMQVVPLLALVSVEGIYLDPIKWENIYKEKLKIYLEYKEKVDTWVINNYPKFRGPSDLFSNGATCAINWGSSKQVIGLFRHMGYCPKEWSRQKKRKEYTVGAKAVFKLLTKEQKKSYYKVKFPEIKTQQDFYLAYLILKKFEQLSTTFGKDFLRFIHPVTKKVHSKFNQYMNTGRMSSTSPNLQNIPSGAEYRECFFHPLGVECADFSSQESRYLAEVSQVPSLVNFFAKGDPVHGTDMHCFVATRMYRVIEGDTTLVITKDENPDERQIAKALNFAMSYGASAFSIKDTISTTEEEAEEFIRAWFSAMPGLEDYFEATKKLALKTGEITLSPLGNKYYYPEYERMLSLAKKANSLKPEGYDNLTYEEKNRVKQHLRDTTDWTKLWREYMALKGKLERRALNYKIQGGAAVQTKISLVNAFKAGLTVLIIVHDEFVCIHGPGHDVILSKCMENGANYICKHVPMEAKAKTADHWVH